MAATKTLVIQDGVEEHEQEALRIVVRATKDRMSADPARQDE